MVEFPNQYHPSRKEALNMTIKALLRHELHVRMDDGCTLKEAVRRTNAFWKKNGLQHALRKAIPRNARRKKDEKTKKKKKSEDVVSYSAARRIKKEGFKLETKGPRRPPSDSILRRREQVDKLACVDNRKGDRRWPAYSTSSQIQVALHTSVATNPRTKRKVGVRTIQRDVIAIGSRSRVRKPTPTRLRHDFERRKVWRADVLSRLAAKKGPMKLHWKKIMFSDETWITTKENTGRYQICKKGKRPYPREKKNKFNLVRFHVWGCAWFGGHSKLVIFPKKHVVNDDKVGFTLKAPSYIKRCLSVVSKFRKDHPDYTFLQDGARCHTAKLVDEYTAKMKFSVLQNAPCTPETNMAEKVWAAFHRRIGEQCPTTEEELRRVALKVWNSAEMQKEMNSCCSHFPKAVLELAIGE